MKVMKISEVLRLKVRNPCRIKTGTINKTTVLTTIRILYNFVACFVKVLKNNRNEFFIFPKKTKIEGSASV